MVLVDTGKDKKRMLDRVIRSVCELEDGKCAIGVTVLIDNGLNDLLEDLSGGQKDEIGLQLSGLRGFSFFCGDGSYTSPLPISGEMGVEEAVVDNGGKKNENAWNTFFRDFVRIYQFFAF